MSTAIARRRPTPGVYAPTTAAAMARLEKGFPSDAVTETEMAGIIGEPCGAMTPGYSVVARAVNYVRRAAGIVWQHDRIIPGWRCLDSSARIAVVKQSGSRRVARLARKNLEILATPSTDLNPDEKRDQQILQVTQAMVLASTRARFRQQIASRIANWDKLRSPNPVQLIELMRPVSTTNGSKKQ